MTATAPDLRRAALIAGVMIVAAALLAAIIRVVAASAIRAWLDFPFGGIQPQLGQVLGVLSNNLRLLGGLFGAVVVRQLTLRTGATGTRLMSSVCDVIVVAACVNHVWLVGATVGGYGGRGVAALLPHGPIELAAYSLALSLYVASRREWLQPSRAVRLAGLSVLLLTISAVVEVLL